MKDQTPQETLQRVFGYKEFRFQQEKIINALMEDQDALVIMPTGGGKSLCYQIPALIKEGVCLVISPLIALMNDQVSALKLLGVKADALHSNVDYEQKNKIYDQLARKELKLLYVSPEKLLSGNFLQYVKTLDVSLIAIDEAHCVSIWGNDFRPEYIQLKVLKELLPKVPTIALTATADATTQKDIMKQLSLDKAELFLSSFERHNISIESRPGQKRAEQILQFLSHRPDEAGIIYCLSRKSTENVADSLSSNGINAVHYHAKLDAAERSKIQLDFQNDKIQVVCATIAFGMGIDKPNIRWVIHYNMPKNLEGFYQEIGRAGRDGQPARSLLFYSWSDMVNLKRFVDEGEGNETFKNVQNAKLNRMWAFSTADNCRTNFILNYFGEFKSDACGHCDNCSHPPKLIDGTTLTKMALSGILRANENIGLNMLIDLLRGSQKQELQRMGLDKLKTFGVGRMAPASHWAHYITQMINQGFIQINFADYSKLKATPLSRQVLYEGAEVTLSEFQRRESKQAIKKEKLKLENVDEDLLQALKSWRNELATEKKVPAYIIVNNKALEQIAANFPENELQLLNIDGIGAAKMKQYGTQIIEIVKEHK